MNGSEFSPSPLRYVTTYLHQVRIPVWTVTGEMRARYETADHYIGELIQKCREYIRRLEDLEVLDETGEAYEPAEMPYPFPQSFSIYQHRNQKATAKHQK